jgi:hypothetical protein
VTRNDWIPIGISLLALVGTLGNFVLTLSRGRKHLHISWELMDQVDSRPTYTCRITNTGYIGLQVAMVSVPWSANMFTEMNLQSGDPSRKLDQGESQVWEIDLEGLVSLMDEEYRDPKEKAIIVVEDTAGKKYVREGDVPTIQHLLDFLAHTREPPPVWEEEPYGAPYTVSSRPWWRFWR